MVTMDQCERIGRRSVSLKEVRKIRLDTCQENGGWFKDKKIEYIGRV